MPDAYHTGVSLHSHTNHSKEGLYFIVEYAARHAVLRRALAAEERRAIREQSTRVDFLKSYWTPPLPPLAAFELEKNQIERELGLASMVSITDHDTIEAPMLLRVVPEARRVPVSVEWTVPYKDATFHLGVHNLPSGTGESLMQRLREFTLQPVDQKLKELLESLHENPDILIVLNHPMWDLAGIGRERHECTLRAMLCEQGEYLDALELSGIRSWEENRAVLQLSEACNQLVISGGDRHGCEPNAALNLTDAESFTEFVHEVRKERCSHILFMPQYDEPYTLRVLQTLLEVIREYPDDSNGARHWDERVFHPDHAGVIRPLSALWQKPPFYIRHFFSAVRLLEMAPVRWALRSALTRPQQQQPSFALGGRQEVAQ
ncbi:MAG: PHP domain-containing protein [Terriglobales bacterium]